MFGTVPQTPRYGELRTPKAGCLAWHTERPLEVSMLINVCLPSNALTQAS